MRTLPTLLLAAVILGAFGAARAEDTKQAVRAIRWEHFHEKPSCDPDLEQCGKLLLNAARYGSGRIAVTYQEDPARKMYRVANQNHE